ncbi:hypothetical protein BG000_003709 [Podila horticola]|nr:hypothetical protein BG000_003709 [Podila horticola]
MEWLLDFPIEDESSGDDNPHPPNPNKLMTTAPKPKRIRLTLTTFDASTVSNEVKKDKVIPVKCCAVCCRLLYPEDYCKLLELHKTKIEEKFVKDMQTAHRNGKSLPGIEKITWPLLKHRDHNGEGIKRLDIHNPMGKGEEFVIVCSRNSSSGAQSLKTVMDYTYAFLYAKYRYVSSTSIGCILVPNQTNSGTSVLARKAFSDLGILRVDRSKLTRATRAGHHFVSGRIGLYKSNEYHGAHVGTRGLINLSDITVEISEPEKQKKCDAWDWMKQHHPLIRRVNVDEPSELMNATERVIKQESESYGRRNVNVPGLRACHMGPVGTGGPRTADESSNLENMPLEFWDGINNLSNNIDNHVAVQNDDNKDEGEEYLTDLKPDDQKNGEHSESEGCCNTANG